MHDSGKILTGIAVFLVLITFPIWYSAASGGGDKLDEASLDEPLGERCILEDKHEMRARHMEVLDDWRDSVVRHGNRMVEVDGLGKVEMSLTRTCLECHRSYDNFCARCHDYADVDPYCWDCHIVPEGR